MKINPTAPDGNFVPFSTLYGGSLNEIVAGIAVDNNGIAYITGSTTSASNLTTTANGLRGGAAGPAEHFHRGFRYQPGDTNLGLWHLHRRNAGR